MPRVQSRSGQRFAAQGDVIRQILEADGAITALLGAGVMGAAVAPSVAGLIDLATGDTHAFNSGEIPLNGVIANVMPTAGLLTGAAVSAINPDVRAFLSAAKGVDGAPGAPQATRTRQVDPGWAALSAQLEEKHRLKREKQGVNQVENQAAIAKQASLRRGSQSLIGGMLIGTLASAFPAIALMRDQPGDAQVTS